jgi:hypothetical protein
MPFFTFFTFILALFENFEVRAKKTAKKIIKCLRFQFCTHQMVCILHFLKKVKFVVPCYIGPRIDSWASYKFENTVAVMFFSVPFCVV